MPAPLMLSSMQGAHDHNRRAWDQRARQGKRFARPAADGELQHSLEQLDAPGWLGDLRDRRLLCLAAGGGRQSVQYALLGAKVTVVDISPEMLAELRAKPGGDRVTTMVGDMTTVWAAREFSWCT